MTMAARWRTRRCNFGFEDGSRFAERLAGEQLAIKFEVPRHERGGETRMDARMDVQGGGCTDAGVEVYANRQQFFMMRESR